MKLIKKILIIVILIVGATSLTSCKKEGPEGPKGDTGLPGPDAQTFNFDLTFNPGDTFKSYSGVSGYDAGDVVLTFILYETLGGTGYWTQAPVIINNLINVVPEFSETSVILFINTLKADGTVGSPWATTVTVSLKAVLIKSSGLRQNPDVDLTNYEAVKKAFNLAD